MSNGFPEWWKHGQKVRTRKDGILTLNIAPDAEYWLTNDAGKEVYVFSADILGPVKNDAEVFRPMSNIDKRALREAAKKAGADEWCAFIDTKSKTYSVHTPGDNRCGDVVKWAGFDGQKRPAAKAKFIAAANPATVLALLDELESKDTQTVEMPTFDGYVPHVARELQEAFRIACDNAGINIAAAGKGDK